MAVDEDMREDEFERLCQKAIDKACETKGFHTFTLDGITITAGRHSSVSGLRRIFNERQEKANES